MKVTAFIRKTAKRTIQIAWQLSIFVYAMVRKILILQVSELSIQFIGAVDSRGTRIE